MEQGDFDNCKIEILQVKLSPETHRKFKLWCTARELKMSGAVRMVIRKLLTNAATFPGYKNDSVDEVNAAVEDVGPYMMKTKINLKNEAW